MADGTIIQVGNFVSTGANVNLVLPMGVDWVSTINFTQANINNNTQYAAVNSYWQLGMAANDGYIGYLATGAGGVISASTCAGGVGAGAVPGYILLNTSNVAPSAPIATTGLVWVASTTATFATGNTAGLVPGAIVMIYGMAGGAQWGGVPFVINNVTGGTNFVINAANNANKGTAPINSISVAAAADYQVLSNGLSYWYPETLVITDIAINGTTATVTTSVPHGLTPGQAVRINIPPVTGLSSSYQLNGFLGQIKSIGGLVYDAIAAANIAGSYTTFDLDITSVGAVSTFHYPLTANIPCTPPFVTPVGESTGPKIATVPSWNSNSLEDATLNQAYIGIMLGGGLSSPAGSAGDVIYWRAGKSFNT